MGRLVVVCRLSARFVRGDGEEDENEGAVMVSDVARFRSFGGGHSVAERVGAYMPKSCLCTIK
jgi:hypothetical protein